MALDADELQPLLGYTMIAFTNVDGDFEGADFDKTVELSNGMRFRFLEYSYTYAYMPSAAVFAQTVGSRVLYKLVIDDEIYDVARVR